MASKPVENTEDPAVAWAEKLFKRLESGLLDIQNTIIEIIKSKAWESLGYESFSKAWIDRVSHITIASELRPHIVYQMFEEGLTPDQVADAVKGITPESAEELKRQHDVGVAADQTVVRRHHRAKPGPKAYLHLPFDREVLAEFHRRARVHKFVASEFAAQAVVDAFNALED